MLKYLSVLFILLSLNGCFSLTPYALNGLEDGMTSGDVEKRMGHPYTTKGVGDSTMMTYYIYGDLIDFVFTPDKFPFIGFYPLLRTGQEYWIVLEDDKVVAFGNKKDFDNKIIKLWQSTPKKLQGKKFSDEEKVIKMNVDIDDIQ